MRQHFGYSKADLVEREPISARRPRNGCRLQPRQWHERSVLPRVCWLWDEIIVVAGFGR